MSRCNPLLCTPTQFWLLIGNRYRLRANDFDPGAISDVTHAGSGAGTMRVADLPMDAYACEVAIVQSGDVVPSIGTSSAKLELTGTPTGTFSMLIEIMATGFYRYSLTAGASYSTTLPIADLVVQGVTVAFIGPFTVGESFTFSTVGPARARATIYNVSNPVGGSGTGSVVPSGQVTGNYRIAVYFSAENEFYYSVNGGVAVGPNTATLTIPGVGITLTLVPGSGPSYYGAGDYWVIETKGSFVFTVPSGPYKLGLTGLQLVFDPPVTSPNLLAGDSYAFSTSAPPDLLEMLVSASAEGMAMLRARYRNQILLAWDSSVTGNAGRIALETLYDRKGQNWKEDRQTFVRAAEQARAWFELVGRKKRHPDIVATPQPGVLAPRVLLGQDLEGIGGGPFGEEGIGWVRV